MKQQESFEFSFSNEEMEKFIIALKDAQANYIDKEDVSYNIKLSRVGDDLGMEIEVRSLPNEASDLKDLLKKVIGGDVVVEEITGENKEELFNKLKNLVNDKLGKRESSLLEMCKENEERFFKVEEDDLPSVLKGISASQEQIDNLNELFKANGKKLPEETLKLSEATKKMYGTLLSRMYYLSMKLTSADSQKIISKIIDLILDQLSVLKSFK